MFDKILIANRGEIACRVALTCRRLGIRTVAVYSDADARARHVTLCDEAWRLGPAPASQSYLRGDAIIEAAKASGAEAIHPGYGFLSENAGFARACAEAGIVFIGPPPEAIDAMGSKSAAKAIMGEAGVPLVPGYHGDDQADDHLAREAETIGYPVLIKASAGGGGKGMRRVDRASDFATELAAARREAKAGFGDDHMLVEKYLVSPRHIEVQVFADSHGNVVHLFERDCSIQRRHQKVIEEAPAPGLTDARRREMGDAATRAARAIGYVGAGTVEFIASADGDFFFMEMNTRLQVEHPVTEMITGQDLVEWQLRVAAGGTLPVAQNELAVHGHAFEARLYAEDPEGGFLPATGTLDHLRLPPESNHVRIDTGVREGDEVSVHYDPMIAKLVVWDEDRTSALRRLRNALAACQIVGLKTNVAFLGAVASHPAFAAGEVETGFIENHHAALFPESGPVPDRTLALACLAEFLRIDENAARVAAASGDPWSPWHDTSGWVLNDDNHHTLHFRDGDEDIAVTAHYRPGHYLLELPGGEMRARGEVDHAGNLRVDLDGVRLTATVVRRGSELTVICDGTSRSLVIHDPLTVGMEDEVREGSLTAPMPGTVVSVMIAAGDPVTEGQALMVLEAMKMEYTVKATTNGTVEAVNFGPGDQVSEGTELLSITPED